MEEGSGQTVSVLWGGFAKKVCLPGTPARIPATGSSILCNGRAQDAGIQCWLPPFRKSLTSIVAVPPSVTIAVF
jgi:hypothetical protein